MYKKRKTNYLKVVLITVFVSLLIVFIAPFIPMDSLDPVKFEILHDLVGFLVKISDYLILHKIVFGVLAVVLLAIVLLRKKFFKK
jgi:hypothetical protein